MFGAKKATVRHTPLQDEASAQMEDKISREVIVHKMPKNYKSGSFDYNDYFNKNTPAAAGAAGAATSASNPSRINKPDFAKADQKKTGVVIISLGVLIVAALLYGLYVYIAHPEKFSFLNLNSAAVPTSKATIPPLTNTAPVNNHMINSTTTPPAGENSAPTSTAPLSPTSTSVVTPPITAPVAPITITTSTPAAPVVALVDTDKDGLNDAEEALLGTDPTKADTNGNKYNDLTELLNLYNPVGTGRLETNTAYISKYSNPTYKYSILYPKAWKQEALNSNSSVILTAADNSFIQIAASANTAKQSINAWYSAEFNQAPTTDMMTKIGGFDAITTTDGLTAYVTDGRSIFIISYTPISDGVLTYKDIFAMILKSFTVSK